MNYEELVNENIGLVHACCQKMRERGIEYDDLFSAGCMGLVKAAKRFDESKGFKFSTYAVPVIFGEIKQLFRDNNPVKIGRALKELSLKVVREREILSVSLGREPTVTELSEKLGILKEEVIQAICAAATVKSLDSDEGLSNKASINTEEKTLNRIALIQALQKLDPLDRELITLRYFKDKTQSDTAKILGISQVQVSRKEKNLLKTLKNQLIS